MTEFKVGYRMVSVVGSDGKPGPFHEETPEERAARLADHERAVAEGRYAKVANVDGVNGVVELYAPRPRIHRELCFCGPCRIAKRKAFEAKGKKP